MTSGETVFLGFVCVAFLAFAVVLWRAERTWKS